MREVCGLGGLDAWLSPCGLQCCCGPDLFPEVKVLVGPLCLGKSELHPLYEGRCQFLLLSTSAPPSLSSSLLFFFAFLPSPDLLTLVTTHPLVTPHVQHLFLCVQL